MAVDGLLLRMHVSICGSFPSSHRFDQTFYGVMVLLVWVAILTGFIDKNVTKFREGTLGYPWVVHVHGLLYSLWLVFFTAQEILSFRPPPKCLLTLQGQWGISRPLS